MKKTVAFLLAMIFLFSMLTGCGSESASSKSAKPGAAKEKAAAANAPAKAAEKAPPKETAKTEKTEAPASAVTTATESQPVVNAILEQRSIIRNANVTLEVESYDDAYGKIQTMVEHAGIGYIQQSNDTKHGSSGRSGMLVVRVDAERFSQILSNVKRLGNVLDSNESTDDVTGKVYDTGAQLRLLKYEQSRLEAYLKLVKDTDSIIKTESRLTELKHEIETLTGTLDKLSKLVKLSTITVSISEKAPEKKQDSVVKEKTYWQKLFDKLSNSVQSCINFVGQVFLFIFTYLPLLILLVLLGWLGRIFYKRRKKAKVRTEETKQDETNIHV